MGKFSVKTVSDGNKCGDTIVRRIYHEDKLSGEVLISGYFGHVWGVDVNLWSGNNANDKRCYFYPDKSKTIDLQIEDCVIGTQKQISENILNDVYTERERKEQAYFETIKRPEQLKGEIKFDKLKLACEEYLNLIDSEEEDEEWRDTVESQERHKVFKIAMESFPSGEPPP